MQSKEKTLARTEETKAFKFFVGEFDDICSRKKTRA